MTSNSKQADVWNRRYWACLVLIFASVVFAYHQGLRGPFLLDDYSSVVDLEVESLDFNTLKKTVISDTSGPVGRPLTIATFVLNKYYSAPNSSFGFKTTNLAFHLFCAFLVFLFLKTVYLHSSRDTTNETQISLHIAALLCTAAWALHPLQVSTVLYVVQRMAILSTLFSLLALVAYARLRCSHYSPLKQAATCLLICGFIVLGTLSKENGILVIPLLSLVEICIFKFKRADGSMMAGFKKAFIFSHVILFIVALAGAYYAWDHVMSSYSARDYGLLERAASQPGALLLYLKMILLPNLSDMSLFHDGFPVPRSLDVRVYAQVAIILSIALSAVVLVKRHPIYTLGVGIFLISHLMESTILPLEPVFEHRNYLALLGILIPIFWYGRIGLQRLMTNRLTLLVSSIALLFLLSQTFIRSFEWSDFDIIINQAAIEKPESIRARNTYIAFLEKSEDAEQVLKQLRIDQQDFPSRSHLVIHDLMFTGISEGLDAALLERTQSSLSKNPIYSYEVTSLYGLLGRAKKDKFSWIDIRTIQLLYELAIANPVKHITANTESILYENYAVILRITGEYDEALRASEKSIQLDPTAPLPRLTRAFVLANNGRFQESQTELDTIRTLNGTKHVSALIENLQELLDMELHVENVL